jgi:MerR family transcriptional regulator, copper efflux regulator
MRIGEIAEQTGMTVQAVRFYERQGLMPRPPRTDAGYRVYAEADSRRLQFIRQAKRLGFSLQEIVRILRLRERGHCPCHEVIETLEHHLRDTEDQIQRLRRFHDEIAWTLKQWKQNGTRQVPGEFICGLIERTIGGSKVKRK